MTDDEQTIITLTREKRQLERQVKDLANEILHIGMALSRAGVANGFEDGDSYDSYSESERTNILVNSYEELKKKIL